MLTVIRIRQVYAKVPLQTRVQRRQRFLQKLKSNTTICANVNTHTNDSLACIVIPELADCATQTTKPQMRSRSTETEAQVPSVHHQQQTIRRVLRKQSSQTDPNSICQSVQTEHRIGTRSTQTNESSAETTSSQTENYCHNNQVQTEPVEEDNECAEQEKEALVFMLNEIGEMIINQNHLLQNNSTMLNQISEMAILSKVAARQKNVKHFGKHNKMLRLHRKPGRYRIGMQPKQQKLPPVNTRNQWVQTTYPIGLSSKTTQTRREPRRRRRFRVFCF